MKPASIVAIDLAKNVFQLHGAASDGSVVFRKKVTRASLPKVLTALPPCVVVMEACSTSHYWGREALKMGHEVKLIAPRYVKPFVKRQKNDAADAEAIAEAALRPTMRFVHVKEEGQQSKSMLFRTRDLYVRQRTQQINALKGHLAEYGIVVNKKEINVQKIHDILAVEQERLPSLVVELANIYFDQVIATSEKIAALDRMLATMAEVSGEYKRLQTIPGVGPICATAIEAFAPPMETFRTGRDFAAWLGLVPRQHSSGGKERLGRTSKMGQRDIRRLLIVGAMAVVRWAKQKGNSPNAWLAQMVERKPRMLVAVALANKMARCIWAMMTKQEDYRVPAAAA